jgi:hypothetical protein
MILNYSALNIQKRLGHCLIMRAPINKALSFLLMSTYLSKTDSHILLILKVKLNENYKQKGN